MATNPSENPPINPPGDPSLLVSPEVVLKEPAKPPVESTDIGIGLFFS